MKFMRQAAHFAGAAAHLLCHGDKIAQGGHWHTQNKCGTCLLCLIVRCLSLAASDPIFKPKIKQRVDYVFVFCAWRRLDRGVEKTTTTSVGTWYSARQATQSTHRTTRPQCMACAEGAQKKFSSSLKKVPKTLAFSCTGAEGGGGEGVQGGAPPPPPPCRNENQSKSLPPRLPALTIGGKPLGGGGGGG